MKSSKKTLLPLNVGIYQMTEVILFRALCNSHLYPGKSKFLSHINIMAQIGFNITVNRLWYEYGYNPFNTALGIGFRLGPIAKKDKE